MSAFMVNKVHIDQLVSLAILGPVGEARPDRWGTLRWYTVPSLRGRTIGQHNDVLREARRENADDIGAMLMHENLRSLEYRYPDILDGGQVPGPVHEYWHDAYTYQRPRRQATAVEGLKAIDGYTYQSCEHDEWDTSEALQFCEALKDALISCLDGYNEAPWTWQQKDADRDDIALAAIVRRVMERKP